MKPFIVNYQPATDCLDSKVAMSVTCPCGTCWVAAGWENDGFNDKTVPLSHNGLRFLRRETLQNAVLLN